MTTDRPMIFTIGYYGLPVQRLKLICEALDADLIDVRARPQSRNPQYRKGALHETFGMRYVSSGHHLGGMGNTTPAGIRYIHSRTRNSLLMCMCHAPGDCHRHGLITGPHFPDAIHIFEDELLRSGELQETLTHDTEYTVLGSLDDLLSGRTKPVDLLA